MASTQERKPTLILGGTGKTGRRVAERLAARGLPARIGSRSANPPFDWSDRSTWAPALDGVGAVYITYFPDLAAPGAPDAIAAFIETSLSSGVRRLVLLSGRGEEEAQHAEEKLRASSADWTILRCSWFAQNFSETMLLDGIVAGEVVLPVGPVPEPFIDAEDIADAAVAALTEEGHVGKLYELTGPRALTFADAVAEIARATGRDIRYVEVSRERFAGMMAEAGVPADMVALYIYLFTEVVDGRNTATTDGVQRALGRPPRDFADYVRDTAASGVWAGAPQ